jgi:pimeloyl-ACP methyl ester carboxylesterase
MSVHSIKTELLEIVYEDEGPRNGEVILLLHGWPDDIRSWRCVAPVLHAAGFRTITPYLRGHGPTRFLSSSTIRDGRGVALAQDVIDLADALGLRDFAVLGHDWGARTAYILAALFPARVTRIAAASVSFQPNGEFPIPSFHQSRLFWYQWFMCVDGGVEAIRADPYGFARIQWNTWSPEGWYHEEDFLATAVSFDNPDWVDITLNGYRSRFCETDNDPRYQGLQHRLSNVPTLATPTLMIQGGVDTCDEPEASEGQERNFTGIYRRHLLDGVGHFPTREAPEVVAESAIAHFLRPRAR